MALIVWSPSDRIHLSRVASKGPHSFHRVADIKDHHIVAILLNCGQIKFVPLAPCHPEERLPIRGLVDDSAVFEVSQVEVSDRAVLARGSKHLLVPEANIVNG